LDFLVIGAQKAATSWLYRCLKEHPNIALPVQKYEVEYLGGNLSQIYGNDWYAGLIPSRQGAIRGDVSVEYLFDARSPKAVQEYAPEVKLIAVLREPIDRAISAYAWSRRSLTASTQFPATAEETFRIILDREYTGSPRIAAQLAELVTRGFYDTLLARWLDVFAANTFLILTYDEIRNDPMQVLEKLYNFIGAPPNFTPESLNSQPKRTNYTIPESAQTKRNKLTRLAVRAYEKLKTTYTASDTHSTFRISDQTRERLATMFADSVQSTDVLLRQLPEKQRPQEDLMLLWEYSAGIKSNT